MCLRGRKRERPGKAIVSKRSSLGNLVYKVGLLCILIYSVVYWLLDRHLPAHLGYLVLSIIIAGALIDASIHFIKVSDKIDEIRDEVREVKNKLDDASELLAKINGDVQEVRSDFSVTSEALIEMRSKVDGVEKQLSDRNKSIETRDQ